MLYNCCLNNNKSISKKQGVTGWLLGGKIRVWLCRNLLFTKKQISDEYGSNNTRQVSY